MAMKYICFDNGRFDELIIFGDNNEHSTVASKYGIKEDKILSAGFVGLLSSGSPYCYGMSYSLRKQSRDIDTKILSRYMSR